MRNLMDFQPDDYGVLLASDKVDASQGALGADSSSKIPPDTLNRTILIGLGGTGIKTIDYVKRKITEKLDPTWPSYVAFLGIDTDLNEFENAASLDMGEGLRTTLPGVAMRAANPASYPQAWRPFADPEQVKHLPAIDGNGAGRKRLIGKMKIHDKNTGNTGVDEQIVHKLTTLKGSVLLPISNTGNYEVYVIGSVSGGTCSGGFLEMPALIRKALAVNNVHIHAILYLPDTLLSLDPLRKAELEANGYASLKELNYFEGLSMRLGYSESFVYNDAAQKELQLQSTEGMFTMPYLIGTPAGAAADSDQVARETIAEYLVSLLGKMVAPGQNAHLVDSFLNNAMQHVSEREYSPANPEEEAAGQAHDFPKRYATIGFAKASSPKEIVRAYVTGEACKKAGLQSVAPEERAALIAQGVELLPFSGEKDYMAASLGAKKAAELLKPLTDFMSKYECRAFNLSEFPNTPLVEWKEVKEGSFDNAAFLGRVNHWVEAKTGAEALETLRKQTQEVFGKFRDNVKDYVTKEGPFAFVNLFQGLYALTGNEGPDAVGILKMIQRLRDGKPIHSDSPKRVQTVDEAALALRNCKDEVVKCAGLKIGVLVGGKKASTTQDWHTAFNNWVNTRVNVVLRKEMQGITGYLQKNFLEPAMVLADQVRCFGYVMDRLSTTYDQLGGSLTDYTKFRGITDDKTEVNIAAVNMQAHDWLKSEAKKIADAVDGKKVRDQLVESFFTDPNAWLQIPDERIVQTATGSVSLANKNLAVPARQQFDRCMSETVSVNMNVTIENLFTQVNAGGVSYSTYAQQIMNELQMKSSLLFNGHVDANAILRYVMYPSALKTNNPAIANAIDTAAKNLYPQIEFYGSDYADSIMLYQMAAPFEIYHLNELSSWEKQYDNMLANPANGLHGRSPDLKIETSQTGTINYDIVTPWQDYPAITYCKDPKQRDPATGYLSHEGEVRLEMDKIIEEAKKLGILYCDRDSGGYSIYRVYCDKSITWNFDPSLMLPDENGLLPMGRDLAEAVASQNGKNLAQVSRKVELHEGGLLNKPHSTEDWAWHYAARTLYVHRPMFIEIRETLEKFRPWVKQIEEFNINVLAKWKPAKMYRLIQGRVLYPDEAGRWIYYKADGGKQMVANLSEDALQKIAWSDSAGATLVEEGLTLYYVYRKLLSNAVVQDLDAGVARAKQELADPADEDLIMESNQFVSKALAEQTEKAIALGINLENPAKQKQAVLTALDDKDLSKDDVIGIATFYDMAKRWKKI